MLSSVNLISLIEVQCFAVRCTSITPIIRFISLFRSSPRLVATVGCHVRHCYLLLVLVKHNCVVVTVMVLCSCFSSTRVSSYYSTPVFHNVTFRISHTHVCTYIIITNSSISRIVFLKFNRDCFFTCYSLRQ